MKNLRILSILYFITNICISQNTKIYGPIGSQNFGSNVLVLKNGNFVLVDHLYDEGDKKDIGAVYLFNGKNQEIISVFKGSKSNDMVGSGYIKEIYDSHFLVCSPNWNNGIIEDAGAITLINSFSGLNDTLSLNNSIVGSSNNDNIGEIDNYHDNSLLFLDNQKFLFSNKKWDNGLMENAGIVVMIDLNNKFYGELDSNNSLIGSNINDFSGLQFRLLPNNNYLIVLPQLDYNNKINCGAVYWGNKNKKLNGFVNSKNSIIGLNDGDLLGFNDVYISPKSNYYIKNLNFDYNNISNVGSLTWGDGTNGTFGVVDSSNSIIGDTTNDFQSCNILILNNGQFVLSAPKYNFDNKNDVGLISVLNGTSYTNGKLDTSNSLVGKYPYDNLGLNCYLIKNDYFLSFSYNVDRDGIKNVGAYTKGSGFEKLNGFIDTSNSFFGKYENDRLGIDHFVELENGNLIIKCKYYNNNKGAFIWWDKTKKLKGEINIQNSLLGENIDDFSNYKIIALKNGDYILNSSSFDYNNISNVGFVSKVDGNKGLVGNINNNNSIIGQTQNDQIGNGKLFELPNGNIVFSSPFFDNNNLKDVGAVTWLNSSSITTGTINISNSLLGKSENDMIGYTGITDNIVELPDSNYIVSSPYWSNQNISDVGAVTWCNGKTGQFGFVDTLNSIIGNQKDDRIGDNGIFVLSNGNYIIKSFLDSFNDVYLNGCLTFCNGKKSINGRINLNNSLYSLEQNINLTYCNIVELKNNDFIIVNPSFGKLSQGSITKGDKDTGISGQVSFKNSLIGMNENDNLGNGLIIPFKNNYSIISNNLNYNNKKEVGSVTLLDNNSKTEGYVNHCNSIFGINEFNGSAFFVVYNKIYNYPIIYKQDENYILIYFNDFKEISKNLDEVNHKVEKNKKIDFLTQDCRIINTIYSKGAIPLDDYINSRVWIDNIQNDSFVKRHFEIFAYENNKTSDVTFYLTQKEFDDFNFINDHKLPTKMNDLEGISNLRIVKINGISEDNSGKPYSFKGTTSYINPIDSNIVWDSVYKFWKVTFENVGFGGYFITSKEYLTKIKNINLISSVEIYPNPSNKNINILNNYSRKNNYKIIDISGKTICFNTLEPNESLNLNIENFIPGIYIVTFQTGENIKLIKQ